MKYRIAIWAGVGLLVAAGWALYALVTTPPALGLGDAAQHESEAEGAHAPIGLFLRKHYSRRLGSLRAFRVIVLLRPREYRSVDGGHRGHRAPGRTKDRSQRE